MPLSSGYSIQRNEIITIPHKIHTEVHIGIGETILPLKGKIDFSDKSWVWDIKVNGTQYILDRSLGNNFQNTTDAAVAAVIGSIDEEKEYWSSDEQDHMYSEGNHTDLGIVSFEQTIGSFGGLRFKNGYHPAQGEHIEVSYRIHQEQWSSSSGGLLYQLAKDMCINPYDSPEIRTIGSEHYLETAMPSDNTSAKSGYTQQFLTSGASVSDWEALSTTYHKFNLTINGIVLEVVEPQTGPGTSGVWDNVSTDNTAGGVREQGICDMILNSINTALLGSSIAGLSGITAHLDVTSDGVAFYLENDEGDIVTYNWGTIYKYNLSTTSWVLTSFAWNTPVGSYSDVAFVAAVAGAFTVPLNANGYLDDIAAGGDFVSQRKVKSVIPSGSSTAYNVGLWKLIRHDSFEFRCKLEPVNGTDSEPGPTTPFYFNMHTFDASGSSLYTEGRTVTEGGYTGIGVYMPYVLNDLGNGEFHISINGRIIDTKLWYAKSTDEIGTAGVSGTARRYTEFIFVGLRGSDIPWVKDIGDCVVNVTFNWDHSLDVPFGAYVGPNGFSPSQEIEGTHHSFTTDVLSWTYTEPTETQRGSLTIPKIPSTSVNTSFNDNDVFLLQYDTDDSYLPAFKLIYPQTVDNSTTSVLSSCNNISNLVLIESTAGVDILSGDKDYISSAFSGTAPLGQKWRIRFEWLDGTSELKVNIATKYQLKDDGTITRSQGADGIHTSVFREPGELCDIFHEPVISRNVTVTSVKNKSHFLRRGTSKNKYDVAPQYPMSYRLTTTNHGVSLFIWDQASADQDDDFAWFVVQRHVNQLTGQPDITDKTPLHCLYSPSKRPQTFEGLNTYYASADTTDFSPSPTIYDKDGKSYTNPSYSHWVSSDALFDGQVNSIDFFGKGYTSSINSLDIDANVNLQSGIIPTSNTYANYWRSSNTNRDITSLSLQGFGDVPRYYNNNNWNYVKTVSSWATWPEISLEFEMTSTDILQVSMENPLVSLTFDSTPYSLDFTTELNGSNAVWKNSSGNTDTPTDVATVPASDGTYKVTPSVLSGGNAVYDAGDDNTVFRFYIEDVHFTTATITNGNGYAAADVVPLIFSSTISDSTKWSVSASGDDLIFKKINGAAIDVSTITPKFVIIPNSGVELDNIITVTNVLHTPASDEVPGYTDSTGLVKVYEFSLSELKTKLSDMLPSHLNDTTAMSIYHDDMLNVDIATGKMYFTFSRTTKSINKQDYNSISMASILYLSFNSVPSFGSSVLISKTAVVSTGTGYTVVMGSTPTMENLYEPPVWSTPLLDNKSFSYSGNLVFPPYLIDRMSRFEMSAKDSSHCLDGSGNITSESDAYSCRAASYTWHDGGVPPTTDTDENTYSEWKTNSDALIDILTPHSIANKERILDSIVVSLDDAVVRRDNGAYILSYDEWFRHGDPTTISRFLEALDANSVDELKHLFKLPVFSSDDSGNPVNKVGDNMYVIGNSAPDDQQLVWNSYRGETPSIDNRCINQGLTFWANGDNYFNRTTQTNFGLNISSSGIVLDKHLIVSTNRPILNGLLPGDVVFTDMTSANSYFYDFFNKTIHFRHAPKSGSKFSIRFSNFKPSNDYMIKIFEDRDFVTEVEDSYKSINRFVVRESDVLKPWDYHLDATKHSTDSFAIINPYEQLSITDDRNFVFAFPTQLTTQRFYYPQSELDMICVSSADFSSHGGHIEIDKYGDSSGTTTDAFTNEAGTASNPTGLNTSPYPYASHDLPNGERQFWRRNKRKYEGMLSTLPNGNGMRIFFQVSGSSIRHSDVSKGILSTAT